MGDLTSIDWRGVLILIGLAYAPGAFWLWYFYRKDLEPEPLSVIRNCFLAGMAAVLPAIILEQFFKFGGVIFVSVVVAPIVEECLKFSACFLVAYRGKDFDEPMDGIICAVSVAIGFASLENIFYIFQAYHNGLSTLPTVAILRAFFSVPGHALFSVMWGYALGRAKFTDYHTGKRLIFVGLGLGIAAHSVFNMMAFLEPFWALGMMMFIPVVWGFANSKIAEAVQLSPHSAKANFRAKLWELKKNVISDANAGQWYENRFIVVVLLFFVFFPVGFYALYRNSTLSRPEKAAYIVLWLVWIGIGWTGMK
ncbi:MAG: PrsW family glutamic-type intramembrane protease [Pseudomonadota bacterium]